MTTRSKLALLSTLYFSQGLPFGFFTQALPTLMRQHEIDLKAIGLANLLFLPWALKFLWAAPFDRMRRKPALLALQACAIVALIALSATDPALGFAPILAGVLLVNLLSATQDIATDGLAVDLLAREERGLGNGVQVAGYRIGMMAGGGVLLVTFPSVGWSGTFLLMAAMLALATLALLPHRERARAGAAAAASLDLAGWVSRPGALAWLGLLMAFKAGDALATGMLRPFLVDQGWEVDEVGSVLGLAAFGAGLAGAMLGGWLAQRVGRRRAILWCGLAQSISVGLYVVPALGFMRAFPLIAALEHLTGGMATVALFTAMMDTCRPSRAATDYTVQACAVVIATGLAQSISGFPADALGWPAFFALSSVLSLAGVLYAARFRPRAEFGLA